MTTVLVVDDQPLVRSAVCGLLEDAPDVTVVGEAGDGIEALRQTLTLRPDVVVMDIRMPKRDGIEATRDICTHPELTATKVLILTTFEEDDYVLSALRAGASGFIGKGAEPDEIARAVSSVHAGESLLSPRATKALIERYVARPPAPIAARPIDLGSLIEPLTAREDEILLLVAQGMTNQEIAAHLVISPFTVKTHVNRVMTKLRARNRAQLVIYAYETGIIRPGV